MKRNKNKKRACRRDDCVRIVVIVTKWLQWSKNKTHCSIEKRFWFGWVLCNRTRATTIFDNYVFCVCRPPSINFRTATNCCIQRSTFCIFNQDSWYANIKRKPFGEFFIRQSRKEKSSSFPYFFWFRWEVRSW